MEFICPVCKTAGEIPDDNLDRPATKTTCLKCGVRLSINLETRNVETLTADQNEPPDTKLADTRPPESLPSVLSMSQKEKGKRDYAAIMVFMVVLAVLIAAGVYFTKSIDKGVLDKPLQAFSKLVDEFSRYSKAILGEFQKEQKTQDKQTRRAQKLVRRGYDHYKGNRLKKAKDELDKAIQMDPKNPEAYFWRARTLIKMGQHDNAIADLQTVVELNPGYSRAYDNLGWLYMRRDKLDESLFYLNSSIKLKPDNGWAHYMRSRIFLKKGDLQKALQSAKTACELDFKDGCEDYKRYKTKTNEKG
jgi:tetratricopeptide (TPR) repeat protein